jgi:hypothetical protein
MDLSAIPEEDRDDFRARLARLGVNPDAVDDETIEVEAGKSLRLEMVGESPVSPMIFETRDLDTLRRWIGSPDKAVQSRRIQPFEGIIRAANIDIGGLAGAAAARTATRRRARTARSASATSGARLSEITKVDAGALKASVDRVKAEPQQARLSAIEVDTLRAAARTYIHGDVASVAEFKPAIESFFETFQVAVWLKTKIVVKRNSTLALGTGVHNLTAYEIIIESGGRIRSHGHLTVSATKVRRPALINPGLSLPNHVLTVNPLNRDPLFP